MNKIYTLGCLIILMVLTFISCTTSRDAIVVNETKFRQGNHLEAQKEMDSLISNPNDRSFPLFQLTNGTMLYALGNFKEGLEMFQAGSRNLETDIGDASTARDMLRREDKTHYRGYDHERVMAKYYTGLGYLQMRDYENAIIAFRQALERDVNKEDMQDKSYISIHYLLGESYIKAQELNNAEVAYRNAVQWDEDFAPAWYKLAYVLNEQNRTNEANEAYTRYKNLTEEPYIAIDGSTPYIHLIIDVGYGPDVDPDAFTGQFASYREWSNPENSLIIEANNYELSAYEADNIFEQAKAEKRAAGEATRKVASVAAKTAASEIPIVGLFVSGPTADTRKWNLLPGEIHVALVPAPKGANDITLKYQNIKSEELKDYQQSFYYLPSNVEESNVPIYLRNGYRIQDQNKYANK